MLLRPFLPVLDLMEHEFLALVSFLALGAPVSLLVGSEQLEEAVVDDEWLLSESEPTELLGGLSGKMLALVALLPPLTTAAAAILALVSTKRIEPDAEPGLE